MAARGFSDSSAGGAADPGSRGCGAPHMVGGGRGHPILADIPDQLGIAAGHDDGVKCSSGVFDGPMQVSSWLVKISSICVDSTND